MSSKSSKSSKASQSSKFSKSSKSSNGNSWKLANVLGSSPVNAERHRALSEAKGECVQMLIIIRDDSSSLTITQHHRSSFMSF